MTLPPPHGRIKNCGLNSASAVRWAIAEGADFLGFIHHPGSPRHVPMEGLRALLTHAREEPVAKTVIVLIAPENALVDALPPPDFWQIHGVTDAERIAAIHRHTGVPVITAIVAGTDKEAVAPLEAASAHLLFDSPNPGSGQRADWNAIREMKLEKPWFLAGGLTAETVGEAIRTTHAPMVDVASGIESSRGVKSQGKIAAFNAAARAAFAAS